MIALRRIGVAFLVFSLAAETSRLHGGGSLDLVADGANGLNWQTAICNSEALAARPASMGLRRHDVWGQIVRWLRGDWGFQASQVTLGMSLGAPPFPSPESAPASYEVQILLRLLDTRSEEVTLAALSKQFQCTPESLRYRWERLLDYGLLVKSQSSHSKRGGAKVYQLGPRLREWVHGEYQSRGRKRNAESLLVQFFMRTLEEPEFSTSLYELDSSYFGRRMKSSAAELVKMGFLEKIHPTEVLQPPRYRLSQTVRLFLGSWSQKEPSRNGVIRDQKAVTSADYAVTLGIVGFSTGVALWGGEGAFLFLGETLVVLGMSVGVLWWLSRGTPSGLDDRISQQAAQADAIGLEGISSAEAREIMTAILLHGGPFDVHQVFGRVAMVLQDLSGNAESAVPDWLLAKGQELLKTYRQWHQEYHQKLKALHRDPYDKPHAEHLKSLHEWLRQSEGYFRLFCQYWAPLSPVILSSCQPDDRLYYEEVMPMLERTIFHFGEMLRLLESPVQATTLGGLALPRFKAYLTKGPPYPTELDLNHGLNLVQGHEGLIFLVIERWVENAREAMKRLEEKGVSMQGEVIRIQTRRESNEMRLSVTSPGRIPEDLLQSIPGKGQVLFQLNPRRESVSRNIGNPFAGLLVRWMGGKVEAQNIQKDGRDDAVFTMRLPMVFWPMDFDRFFGLWPPTATIQDQLKALWRDGMNAIRRTASARAQAAAA